MSARADVAGTTRTTPPATPLARRTPGVALIEALAEYPGLKLWQELRQMLPPEAAARAFRAAERVCRDIRA